MSKAKTTSLIGLSLLYLGSLAGCSKGPPIAKVKGRITFDGTPVALATVEFIPENGRPSYAQTDENGHYRLLYLRNRAGALAGTHKVRISTWREEHLGDDIYVTHKETLPPEYNSRSKLTYEVEPGRVNVADFELVSGGKAIQPQN